MKTWYQRTEEDILTELHVTKDGHRSEAAAELLETKGENVLEGLRNVHTVPPSLFAFSLDCMSHTMSRTFSPQGTGLFPGLSGLHLTLLHICCIIHKDLRETEYFP